MELNSFQLNFFQKNINEHLRCNPEKTFVPFTAVKEGHQNKRRKKKAALCYTNQSSELSSEAYPLVASVGEAVAVVAPASSSPPCRLLPYFEELGMIDRTKLPKILALTWPLLGRGLPFFSSLRP
ncbi:hypothetical protein HPP92_013461 [Vanilla planifolia]|uniref:Uncharacterized protein n=1 Tax=Vanilla planifolia TaxID=51239 RepID=A0A835R204_VANPL|nr:hypothetical protein HPP92_013903 [Vanilla planifolia]KAG0478742.1 hypothetical protein HPP92_013461 [Vanilla planifolia]